MPQIARKLASIYGATYRRPNGHPERQKVWAIARSVPQIARKLASTWSTSQAPSWTAVGERNRPIKVLASNLHASWHPCTMEQPQALRRTSRTAVGECNRKPKVCASNCAPASIHDETTAGRTADSMAIPRGVSPGHSIVEPVILPIGRRRKNEPCC